MDFRKNPEHYIYLCLFTLFSYSVIYCILPEKFENISDLEETGQHTLSFLEAKLYAKPAYVPNVMNPKSPTDRMVEALRQRFKPNVQRPVKEADTDITSD
ncbi:unnamed protein product [Caenorhabditis angaria]|uniref:Uncharacterized protein n=1 Tax=Caenorhabditis angaria TaxID=860376 RepID=A0A9P1IV81_9PELO|nr:unnamed protein product [Caenorhabditis angaria]